ncbi:hypothetical protein FB45DRAFT_1082609 [Roridomyces roridus]|uniref:C2H2-type domain-containing protein n=1 Tax=Roridomyces roridus TaxID=1738132 RepID=A0AAD7BQF3_9AGAR|nr:hypothetical protein FB45DRAFT_1082609 [Roridomyces roridus]
MSFSLPMSTLATMQISLKVRLPDGALSFEMHPPPPTNSLDPAMPTPLPPSSGMKQLHVLTGYDFSGVTLTLFTSGTEESAPPPVIRASEMEPRAPTPAVGGDSGPRPLDEMYNRASSGFVFSALNKPDPHHIANRPAAPNHPRTTFFLVTFSRDSMNTTPDASPITSPRGELAPPPLDTPTWMPIASANVVPDLSAATFTAPPKPRGRRHHRFPCTMGCLMFFSRKHDRLRHEVAQHGRLCDWECASCQGFFSSQATFKKHRCKPVAVARRIGDRDREGEATERNEGELD